MFVFLGNKRYVPRNQNKALFLKKNEKIRERQRESPWRLASSFSAVTLPAGGGVAGGAGAPFPGPSGAPLPVVKMWSAETKAPLSTELTFSFYNYATSQ